MFYGFVFNLLWVVPGAGGCLSLQKIVCLCVDDKSRERNAYAVQFQNDFRSQNRIRQFDCRGEAQLKP